MGTEIEPTTLAAAVRAGTRGDERSMAAVAKAAVFNEAVLAAIRARVNELRAVAK